MLFRLSAEQRLSEVISNLEKAAGAYSEEVTALQQSLLTQKQLASKFNDRVSCLLSTKFDIHVHKM